MCFRPRSARRATPQLRRGVLCARSAPPVVRWQGRVCGRACVCVPTIERSTHSKKKTHKCNEAPCKVGMYFAISVTPWERWLISMSKQMCVRPVELGPPPPRQLPGGGGNYKGRHEATSQSRGKRRHRNMKEDLVNWSAAFTDSTKPADPSKEAKTM